MTTAVRTPRSAVRNNVTQLGPVDGPVLLLAHGFGCDQGMWSRIVPAFVQDHRIVLFDHVGSGGSDLSAYDKDKYASLDGYVADLIEICDELQLRDVVLVAHSVSAMMAVRAAGARPDLFSRLVLVAPSPRAVDDPADGYVGGFSSADVDGLLVSLERNYFAWAAMMAPMVMGDEGELGEELQGSFCRVDPAIARDFAEVTFRSDSRPALQAVRTPSLVLQCTDDALAPSTVGRYLHERLAGSTLVQLAATGHCPHVSAPAETVAAISTYLNGSP